MHRLRAVFLTLMGLAFVILAMCEVGALLLWLTDRERAARLLGSEIAILALCAIPCLLYVLAKGIRRLSGSDDEISPAPPYLSHSFRK